MKKFVLLYHTPAEAVANRQPNPEEQAKAMEAWFNWRDRCGDSILDFGAPFASSLVSKEAGELMDAKKGPGGYSIVQSQDLDGVKALLEDHPHLSWAPGTEIEVCECADI